jgi:hypothetical protein
MSDFDRNGAISDEYTEAMRNSSVNSGETGVQATLTFNLTQPHAKSAFIRAAGADELCHVMWELQQWLFNANGMESVLRELDDILHDNPMALAALEEWR